MKRKGKLLFPLLALALGVLVFLLFPLSTRKWNIEYDSELIATKREFLARVREESGKRVYSAAPPNIIIITADDLGKFDMSLYGGNTVDTPNMDAIGKNGVTFTEGYCTAPICSPSRAGMLTGRYQQRYGFEVQPQNYYASNRLQYYIVKYFINTGSWFLVDLQETPKKSEVKNQGLPPSEITLGELLQNYGYATGITGKWHLGYADSFIPNNRGFDYQYGFYEAFTLYSPLNTPGIVEYRHDYFANKHIWRQERKGTSAVRRNNTEIEEDEYLTFRIAEEANRFIETNRGNPFFLYVSFNAPHTPFQAPEEYVDRFSHVPDQNKRVYYAMIAALDDAVGLIHETIDRLEIAENTLILFASDNGGASYTGATDNGPLKGGKFSNFEGGLNIPMMMEWKGCIPRGSIVNDPVTLLDFFNTAAAAAGAELPGDRIYDGVNLLPYIAAYNGEETAELPHPPHEALFWRAAYNKVVRKGPWKLIIDEKADRTLLYNMDEDKSEHRNLAEQLPKVVSDLESELSAWEKELLRPLWPRVMDFRFTCDGEIFDFAL